MISLLYIFILFVCPNINKKLLKKRNSLSKRILNSICPVLTVLTRASLYSVINYKHSFVSSVLEQSSVVWHSSLTSENRKDLERLQKTAVRIILWKTYNNYKEGLTLLNLQTLHQRRKTLCLKFARKCLMNEKVRQIFPKNTSKHKMKKRKTKPFKQSKITL